MKRIVIVGAGFAGLAAARALRHSDAEVFVVDRANHNLFQPLLYQVATTVLSPAQNSVSDPWTSAETKKYDRNSTAPRRIRPACNGPNPRASSLSLWVWSALLAAWSASAFLFSSVIGFSVSASLLSSWD